MTAFTKDMIPASITTTEQLEVWVSELHTYLYGTLKTVEALDDNGEPLDTYVVESQKYWNTAPATPEWRHLARHSIKLSKEYLTGGKVWEYAQPIGNEVVPTAMRS